MTFHTQFQPTQVHNTVFIAPGAVIVGDVTLAEEVNVWFNAVLRADTEALRIGAGTNIQDGAILHADPGYPTVIGRGCTIGHGAIIHGAQIGDNTLIGMGAILLNGVHVGQNCIVGAGALLTQGKIYPPGTMILGSPAKIIRDVKPEEIEANRHAAAEYVQKGHAFKKG
jgi:carbonic anhydrase/acetyltransferase-like protein (isoleucine patch superfamily)